MSEWPTVTLKEAGVTLIDCDHKTPKAQDFGMPYVGIPQLKEGRITLDGARLISEGDFHHWRRKAKPIQNDVILSRRCNPGVTAYVPEGLEIALGQNLVLLRSDSKKLYPPFLRWVVQGTNWWNQISKFINVGAVFDSLKCADIPNFEIQLPPMESQIRIAEVLGALDNKIELNRQINQTLEQIAQAIFKSWFVDFEPVKAKVIAREKGGDALAQTLAAQAILCGAITLQQLQDMQPGDKGLQAQLHPLITKRLPDQHGLDDWTPETLQTLADTFPDELVESELGEIPKGWKTGSLGEICEQAIGGQWGSDTHEDGLVPAICLRGCDMEDVRDEGFAKEAPVRYIKKSALDKRLMNGTDLLIAASGAGPCGRPLWCSPSLSKENYGMEVIYSNFVKRFTCKSPSHAIYIDSIIYEKYKNGTIGDYITGTSVPNLDATGLLNSFQIIIPDQSILDVFADSYQKNELRKSSSENRILTELRDSLLPKLLSGEIAINESQSTAEAVA